MSDPYPLIEEDDARGLSALVKAEPDAGKAIGPMKVSAVLHCLYLGKSELAELLAGDGFEPDLLEAAALGRARDVRRLATGAALHSRSGDGFSATHYAAFFGRTDCLEILLERGAPADLPADNDSAVRPLHSAMVAPRADSIRVLLDAGVDVNAQQAGGYTALHAAAKRGTGEVVELLLDAGADPDLHSDDGKTAWDLADRLPEDLRQRLRPEPS